MGIHFFCILLYGRDLQHEFVEATKKLDAVFRTSTSLLLNVIFNLKFHSNLIHLLPTVQICMKESYDRETTFTFFHQ